MLGKLSVISVFAIVMMVDQNFDVVWIEGFDMTPISQAFAITPNGQDLFVSMLGSSLVLFNLNGQNGMLKGVLTDTTINSSGKQQIVPNPDSTGIYFAGNSSKIKLNCKNYLNQF
jgi:hypothetical protein